jgi:hypothetical protein
VLDTSPLPFALLMGAGIVIGALGHLYGSRTTVVAGIGLVVLATLALPLALYLSGS